MNKNIVALLEQIKLKDEVTYNHSLRVSNLCYDFCISLGKSKEYAEEMRLAGLLHDVGKIMVPDEVLNKPGRLTDSEFIIMKEHTTNSVKLLITYSELIRNVANGHHLSYVGNGYPNASISGKNIPEECRIAAICDIYEALTAKRQYKEPMSKEKALEIMHSDRKLDPELLAQFEKCIN